MLKITINNECEVAPEKEPVECAANVKKLNNQYEEEVVMQSCGFWNVQNNNQQSMLFALLVMWLSENETVEQNEKINNECQVALEQEPAECTANIKN